MFAIEEMKQGLERELVSLRVLNCSCRGPEFSPQYSGPVWQLTTIYNSSSGAGRGGRGGTGALFWLPGHRIHKHTYTHIHLIKNNK